MSYLVMAATPCEPCSPCACREISLLSSGQTLPQLLTLLNMTLNEHWQADLLAMRRIFPDDDPYEAKYQALVARIREKVGIADGNPFRCFKGQQMRVLQGDGVALDTVGDMLASIAANGFCANCVHFGSGGGLLQKLNRD